MYKRGVRTRAIIRIERRDKCGICDWRYPWNNRYPQTKY